MLTVQTNATARPSPDGARSDQPSGSQRLEPLEVDDREVRVVKFFVILRPSPSKFWRVRGSLMEASTATIRPANTRSATHKTALYPEIPANDPQRPASARS